MKKLRWLLLSWDKVCTPKEEGGLGFHDLKAFNLTLLVQQGWRIQTNTSSFLDSDFLGAELGPVHLMRGVVFWRHRILLGKDVNGSG